MSICLVCCGSNSQVAPEPGQIDERANEMEGEEEEEEESEQEEARSARSA